MKFLRQRDSNGKTAVDLYREKQQAWCQAQAAWDKAKIQAQGKEFLYHDDHIM